MINIVNFLLISQHLPKHMSAEIIEAWLQTESNFRRIEAQCEKIWNHSSSNPHYDAERAFRILSKRFSEVCLLEQSNSTL